MARGHRLICAILCIISQPVLISRDQLTIFLMANQLISVVALPLMYPIETISNVLEHCFTLLLVLRRKTY